MVPKDIEGQTLGDPIGNIDFAHDLHLDAIQQSERLKEFDRKEVRDAE